MIKRLSLAVPTNILTAQYVQLSRHFHGPASRPAHGKGATNTIDYYEMKMKSRIMDLS